MHLLVDNTQKHLELNLCNLKDLVYSVLKNENSSSDEVSIHFCSSQQISILHADFFNDPSSTDCISFPIDEPRAKSSGKDYHVLGEIFVNPQAALLYASNKGSCPYEELSLYVVHGLLHLLGYDDIEPKDRKLMRQAEQENMNIIKTLNLLILPQSKQIVNA